MAVTSSNDPGEHNHLAEHIWNHLLGAFQALRLVSSSLEPSRPKSVNEASDLCAGR